MNPTRGFRHSALLLFILVLCTSIALDASEDPSHRPLIVGPGGDHASIQTAIDAAPEGGTVVVLAGTYRENLSIRRPLSLVAIEGAVVEALETGDPVITVQETVGVAIHGWAIRGTACGIVIYDSTCTITGCDITCGEVAENEMGIGIDINTSLFDPPTSAQGCSIVDCRIQADDFGVVAFALAPYAVSIHGCHFVGRPAPPDSDWDSDFALGGFKGIGLSTPFTCDLTLTESTFEQLATGGLLGGLGLRLVIDSVFRSCGSGLTATDTAEIDLIGNEFVENTLDGLQLCFIYSSSRTTGAQRLIGNTIQGNGRYGIYRCSDHEGDPEERRAAFRGFDNIVSNNAGGAFSAAVPALPDGFLTPNPATN